MGGEFGYGHGVRMRALAQALVTRGATVRFLTTTPDLALFVAPMACHGVGERVTSQSKDMFIIDTKAPMAHTEGPLLALRQHGVRIVSIDNPAATPLTCDLLIGPCNHWTEDTVATLRASLGERFLYGWDYVMLTPETVIAPPLPNRHASRFGIVFCAGGSDPTDALDKMMEWSIRLELSAPLVFLRPCSQHRYLRALRHARLVVGMFGVTGYEALWSQTPMLMFGRTTEDALGACSLEKATHGYHTAGGALWNYTAEGFCKTVEQCYQATILPERQAPSFIDGRGTQRVAEAILAL